MADHCTVLIVGGGPAGLAAALELKRLGVSDVTIVEREAEAGGVPRLCHHTGFGLRDLHRLHSGPSYARVYRDQATAAGVEICTSTTVTDWSGNPLDAYAAASGHGRRGGSQTLPGLPVARTVSVTSPAGVRAIEADAILLATGCRERPYPAQLVAGNRPQGVFTTGSLQRFVYGCEQPVGRRAVVVGSELVSLSAVLTLAHAGMEVAMLVTEHPAHQVYLPYLPVLWYARSRFGAQVMTQARVSRILGHRRVEAVELTHRATGQTEIVACDTVVFTGNWIPEHELARLGALAMDEATCGPQIDAELHTSAQGVFAAGNLVRGAETADHAALEGRHAARSMVRFLETAAWPQSSVPIQAAEPVAWMSPNRISSNQGQPPLGVFLLRVNSFCHNGRLCVYQGSRLLHSRRFRRWMPNCSYGLSSEWLRTVDVNGEAVQVQIV